MDRDHFPWVMLDWLRKWGSYTFKRRKRKAG